MARKFVLKKFLQSFRENSKAYTIESENISVIKRFNIQGRVLKFKVKAAPSQLEPIDWFKNAIEQSISEGLSSDKFCITATCVKLPQGTGKTLKYTNFDDECKHRRGVITISNRDNLCLPRALIVVIHQVEKSVDYKQIIKSNSKLQTKKATELIENAGKDVIFEGLGTGKKLNLLFHKNHYNVITSLTAAFSCIYYCEDCHVAYNNKNGHRCTGSCPKFNGQECFDNHKSSSSTTISICELIHKCFKCLKVYKKDRQHICGEYFFIKQHETTLCVFEQRCDQCIDIVSLYLCANCKIRRKIIEKGNIIETFLNYILEMRKKFKNIIVIAHNGQAFDHQFILNFILEKTSLQTKLIMRGTKVIMMLLGNIKFIDSLNYFPMALSKLPKAFDLQFNMKKGYFPLLFNTAKNENYIRQLPSVEYYNPNDMKVDEQIIEYCVNDVTILTQSCLKFREMFLKQCNVEPFLETTTIASACNLAFRRNFLKEDTISLIPKHGYRNSDNQSKVAIQWLVWEEEKRNINIRHTAKQKESFVNGIKVDGFCSETNQVFEFYSCYYHGHLTCIPHNRNNSLQDDSNDIMNTRYKRTIKKAERLRKLGHDVIEMWQCEFNSLISKEEASYLKNHPLVQHSALNPRDAFYGGRTGNVYNYYKCKEEEKKKYIDICSLYPWVCKYGKFPIGHPQIYVGESICSTLKLNNMDGILKCKILPPTNLLHPVLPLKQNNKLMFSLCRSCSEEKWLEECCPHSDEERALIGTWVIDEVVKAIQKGYKMLEIYKVWEYQTTKYDKNMDVQGLFTNMMNKFIKIKQEASGWPSKCVTNNEKENYVKDFFDKEDIQLEHEKVPNNPGLRSFAKLMLNSFWGKFGQRENLQKTSIINQPRELYNLLTNPSIEVCYIFPVNEENIIVNWQYKEEVMDSLPTVNVCIAAYTTTQARLKLYSYLEKLQERVLYYDTDSVVYISRKGDYEPSVGNFIGDMTDELECYESVLNPKADNEIYILSQNIGRNKEHKVLTVPQIKVYQPKSEKRNFAVDGSPLPYGYKRLKQN
ncbi:uncharacterized protein LOC129607410 [Condylostylus longicornis]|uniref:uncharacterized protein LOC129607410 n=1 Tax=Condylostylus longicornis TaxID=2530218 RepID=UPI00244DB725|nr:uncharacterized protein LOC129607410 [Condylostylus longicornis]